MEWRLYIYIYKTDETGAVQTALHRQNEIKKLSEIKTKQNQ